MYILIIFFALNSNGANIVLHDFNSLATCQSAQNLVIKTVTNEPRPISAVCVLK
jgi:hypothetical protein